MRTERRKSGSLRTGKNVASEAIQRGPQNTQPPPYRPGHRLETDIAPGIRYMGDEYAVRRLVSVLIDNAVKYASPGFPVTLRFEKDRRGVVIRSSNGCENVDADETKKLFDRFYRTDKARSAGGFGIGLSIARGIAEAHKGSIKAELADGNTIEFTAYLK